MNPFDSRMLSVDAHHTLYVEQVGKPNGIPVVFLHGGPGGGCQASHRKLFDARRMRAVLFDQRGAGRSTPKGCLTANTTPHLIEDLERIREALEIERWMVVGGSFGALLAIAYAEAHPSRVSAIALRAVFLGTVDEVDWAFKHGPQIFRPDLWRAFADLLPEPERADPVAAYGRRLMDPSPAVHGPAAWAWLAFEQTLSALTPGRFSLPTSLEPADAGGGALPNAPFVTWHYMQHEFFLEPDALLRKADRLAGIPGIILQGRYDLLCPPKTAQSLADRWPDCELRLIEGAGHALTESGIQPGLKAAIAELARPVT